MFRLTRYFSLASLVAIGLAAALLGRMYGDAARQDLQELGEENNVALTMVLANTLWPTFGPHLLASSALDAAALREHPRTVQLRETIVTRTRGLSVVKVKIYDLQGRTIFSSEAAQIGENKGANKGFQAARQGRPASELTHRLSFSAFEQQISDRDLISSYIPVRRTPEGPVEAVFEVYDDVTPHLGHIAQTQKKVILGIVGVLSLLYAALFLIVHRADRLIRRQADQLNQHVQALSEGRDQLEGRVRERTQELGAANQDLREQIEQRTRAQEQLARALEAAEAASRAKSRFVSNISHEMRTPMIGVLGMTELLQATELSAAQREMVQTTHDSGRQMMAIINDVLDFAKIEAGSLRLEPVDFDLRGLVTGLAETASRQARAKGLDFHLSLDPTIEERQCADPVRLRQILENLISNALKFTPAGDIRIEVRALTKASGTTTGEPPRKTIRFQVSDTGIGMNEQARARLFQAFTQADDSDARRFGGSGLGLALCRQLVILMDGEIGVDSQPGHGSTFWVEIPLVPAASPPPGDMVAPPLSAAPPRALPTTGKTAALEPLHGRLLLVEDNPVNQLVARRLLSAMGMDVEVASDGAQAVAAVQARSFDLVLMDCQMPVMDGYQATQAIRQLELRDAQRPRLPIVALTANALAQDRAACLAAGMDEHLAKPYQREKIHETLARFLRSSTVH